MIESALAYVHNDVLNIAQKIRDYDENLTLAYANPEFMGVDVVDAPYAVWEKCKDGQMRKVFDVWELNDRILDRIYAADNHKVDVLLNLEGNNLRIKQDIQKRYEDIKLDSKDIVQHVIRSPKQTYTADIANPETDEKKRVKFE